MHGPNNFFKTNTPVEEAVAMSNLVELTEKDREYTLKAQAEGKPYYKWDTDVMTILICEDGMEENNEIMGVYGFISRWLAITLKFVEDETVQRYMLDFYENGTHHYKDVIFGKEIYKEMQLCHSPYIYMIYDLYLESRGEEYPEYIRQIRWLYKHISGCGICGKIPNKDGSKLLDVEYEEVEKYMGTWISPEEHKKNMEFIEKLLHGGENND